MLSPQVSVIIPTFNSAGTLRAAIASVLMQDLVDFEVIVVGDGCADNSEATVRAFNDPRLYWTNLARNSGTPSVPRNEALRQARGRYIAYLGHDDLWFPWHLSSLVAILDQGGDFAHSIGVCYGPSGAYQSFTLPSTRATRIRLLSPSNWMHIRELSDRIGPWSTRLKVGVDKEFLLRARSVDIFNSKD